MLIVCPSCLVASINLADICDDTNSYMESFVVHYEGSLHWNEEKSGFENVSLETGVGTSKEPSDMVVTSGLLGFRRRPPMTTM
ncbi:hypothetical protein SK128_020921 [Halocaridina rubra]|uniref:Uncharacterized protein n=1 Tax=Halocaridina rubra TaxID=373956 RepID=A0AAN8XGC2_HALRR